MIVGSSLANMGSTLQVSLFADISQGPAFYFQALDNHMHTGLDGTGLTLYGGDTNGTALSTPVTLLDLRSRTIKLTFNKPTNAGNKPIPDFNFNLFFWADSTLVQPGTPVYLGLNVDGSVECRYGWTHGDAPGKLQDNVSTMLSWGKNPQ